MDGRLVLSPESMLGKIVMEAVTQEGLKEYIEGIDEWLLLCEAMQGMNAHKRIAEGEHVQFEDQSWQLAFQLVRDFLDLHIKLDNSLVDSLYLLRVLRNAAL